MNRFLDDTGAELDAAYEVDSGDLILYSRGGSISSGQARNTDYGPAFRLLLERLQESDFQLRDVLVDSDRARHLPEEERRIFAGSDRHLAPDELFTRLSNRMAGVGQRKGDTGGNRTKRVRFRFDPVPSHAFIIETLGGGQPAVSRAERLPAETLQKVTPQHVWQAVEDIRRTGDLGSFTDSTKFDVLLEDGTRLPPKAVFGRAAAHTLGFELKPHHFSGGEGTVCFQSITDAGFRIVPKDGTLEASTEITPPPEDVSWAEGSPRLVTHLRRERRSGLSNAKKRAFMDEHGHLFCEMCKVDPISEYGQHGEACIEVHHTVPVSEMPEGYETTLDDLMCLCANCHRVVHSKLRQGEN